MANVTAALVKELRDITGAGMMDCKKALVATDGNIEAAIEEMRKSGALKAAKKATRTAAEGIIVSAHEGNQVVLVEVNSETDFAAKNAEFVEFAEKVAQIALKTEGECVETLKAAKYDDKQTVGEALTALIAKIGENLGIRRIFRVTGDVLGIYVDVVEKERQIQIEIAVNSGKPKEIAEKMVEGRMKKFTGEVSLTGQPFVMDPSVSVGEMLKQHGATAKSFIRVEVGEGIEKKEDDFAAEVQAQIAAAANK